MINIISILDNYYCALKPAFLKSNITEQHNDRDIIIITQSKDKQWVRTFNTDILCRHVGTSPVGPVLAGPLIYSALSEA